MQRGIQIVGTVVVPIAVKSEFQQMPSAAPEQVVVAVNDVADGDLQRWR